MGKQKVVWKEFAEGMSDEDWGNLIVSDAHNKKHNSVYLDTRNFIRIEKQAWKEIGQKMGWLKE